MRDWDMLRYVLEIRREGGLSGAARSLNVTHATVSRQLAKAESDLGVILFNRLPTGLEATNAGRDVATHAEAVEAEVLALDLALTAHEDQATGPLRLTVPPLLFASGLAEDLTLFQHDNPGIELSLLGDNQILNLHRREADIAIRVSHDPAESLWGRVIARQTAAWFATPDFISSHAGGLAGGDAAVPVISFTAWKTPIPAQVAALMPGAFVVLTSDDMVGAAALARAGMGMVRMPYFLGADDPRLVRVPGLPLVDYLPIWALTHPDLKRVPRVAHMMQFLAQRFSARQGIYDGRM